MTWTAQDFQFMSQAIKLARRGHYTCDPNPRVGCVVTKNNELLAEGWHAVAGEAHAEINALNDCEDASGSTAYITLEPCSYQGRTPPCVNALIKAQIREVIIAMVDPNPAVSGTGIKQLQAAGITVKQGLLEAEARKLNPGFIQRMTLGRPYVRCKVAMSVDGCTALANGQSQWISSEASRRDVHKLRANCSAILATAESVIQDNALLNARGLSFDFKQPIRVIIDRELKLSKQLKLFSTPGKVIIYTQQKDNETISELEKVGAEVIILPQSELWLEGMFSHLAKEYEINDVMVEAGATFTGVLIDADLVDEAIIYMAPMLLGHDAQTLFKLNKLDKLSEAKQLEMLDVRQIGKDVRLTYNFKNKV